MMSKSYSRHIVHPVALLSTAHGNRENIATMAWVSPVSFTPPLLMVAVSPKQYSHELIMQSGEFALMILGTAQKELSTLAGTQSGRKVNKWELEPFRRLRKSARMIQAPVLRHCRAVYECKVTEHLQTGDHTLFIGEVVFMEADESVEPLILFNRIYYAPGREIAHYP
jgi:flavin reductase (DIM6/NTAB) family NADH-FMN oxidoreductase RutF